MAHRDITTGQLVLRLVFDGPPLAGKTTTLAALAHLLDEPIIRGDGEGGRTETFDWLEHAGGVFEGQRIRFELVAVPGQPEHAARRRFLVEGADVVVLVVDSNEPGLTAGLVHLAEAAGRAGGEGLGPMVLQANKQDLPTAAPVESIEAAVARFTDAIDVVPTSATTADGLRMLLAVAVRRALQSVRSEPLPLPVLEPSSFEGLRDALAAAEAVPPPSPSPPPPPSPSPPPPPPRRPPVDAAVAELAAPPAEVEAAPPGRQRATTEAPTPLAPPAAPPPEVPQLLAKVAPGGVGEVGEPDRPPRRPPGRPVPGSAPRPALPGAASPPPTRHNPASLPEPGRGLFQRAWRRIAALMAGAQGR